MAQPIVRDDFPILRENPDLVYLDNACMSLRPDRVIEAIKTYYTRYSACAGRSNHRLAQGVTEEVEKAREKVRRFIGAKRKEEVVFVRNTSEAINLVANALTFKPGEVVVTSDKEHNSNLVPWLRLKERLGIVHKVVKSGPDNCFDEDAWERALAEGVKLVSIVETSNLDGVTFPIEKIVKLAKRQGAMVMVDAAQSAPHKRVDVKRSGVDFLAFSGHKMCGPSGMGVLYGKLEILEKIEGFMVGGDTVVKTSYDDYELLPPPEKFEAGLQDYAGILGLGAAVDYLRTVGMDNIEAKERELNRYLTGLLEAIEPIKLIGPNDPDLRSGIYAFYIEGVNPHQVALMLDETGKIMVRSGQHCVHSWFNDRGINGSVRASMYFYNTKEEMEVLADKLKAIIQVLV